MLARMPGSRVDERQVEIESDGQHRTTNAARSADQRLRVSSRSNATALTPPIAMLMRPTSGRTWFPELVTGAGYSPAMTRTLVRYRCQSCGHESPKWLGAAPNARSGAPSRRSGRPSGSSSPSRAGAAAQPVPLADVDPLGAPRRATERAQLDRGARRWSGCRIAHARRRGAGHGQEHARAAGVRRDGG